jgi:tetratricopeptide (TPR) repeat protein
VTPPRLRRPTAGLAVAAAVGLAAAVAYLPTLRAGLVWDDRLYVLADGGRHLAGALRGDLIGGANPAHGPAGYYRPVAVATLWVAERLPFGPGAHHAASVLLHAVTAALLGWLLVRRLGPGAVPPAAMAALLWSLHPGNVEAVAWVSARYDLLAGLFAVALLLVPGGRGPGPAALSGLVFLGGLLSKESFAALALVVVADDWGAGRRLREAIPRWIGVGGALAAWLGLRAALSIPPVHPAPLLDLPLHWLSVLGVYLQRAAWPWPLSVSHPFAPAGTPGLIAAGCIAAGLLTLAVRRRDLAPAVALVLGPMVPIALAAGRLGEAPERYLYVPSLGLAWLLAAGLAAARRRGRALGAGATLACGALAVLEVAGVSRRLPDWRSDEALFSAAHRVDPSDPLASAFLAVEAARGGRVEEARDLLERSQARHPGSGRLASTLSWLHLRRGDGPAALEQARRAVGLLPGSPEARLYLSNAHHLVEDHAAELAEAERALRLSPGWPQARIVRALARCEVTREIGCEADLGALEREGVLAGADALVARVEAALGRGDPGLAAQRLELLRALRPGDPRLARLARALARLRGG